MRRPSPALVISLIALFVALGGTGYAAITISGKNVKNRTLTGRDVKKNSLTGTEIRESKLTLPRNSVGGVAVDESRLGKVPSAGRADSAANADRLGGLSPDTFARQSRFFQGYARAAAGANVSVVKRGPFEVRLNCRTQAPGIRWARTEVVVSEPFRAAVPTNPGINETDLTPDRAPQTVQYPETGSASAGQTRVRTDGTYFDVANGRSMEFSSRVRVGGLGAPDCSAHVTAIFNGL